MFVCKEVVRAVIAAKYMALTRCPVTMRNKRSVHINAVQVLRPQLQRTIPSAVFRIKTIVSISWQKE